MACTAEKAISDKNGTFGKGDLRATTEAGHDLALAAHLGTRGRTQFFRARLGAGSAQGPLLNFASRRLGGGELLIVVSNRPAAAALAAYARRWGIECLFGDAKTRGLNIEDTRFTNPRKLDLLMGLVALAIAWAARAAIALLWAPRAPPRQPRLSCKVLREVAKTGLNPASKIQSRRVPPDICRTRVTVLGARQFKRRQRLTSLAPAH